jgi:uncharacterized protein YciI
MDFLFFCRDKPGVGALLEQNAEAHWSFMDGYADRLLIRGPTLSDDGEAHTGSLHIVRLDDVAETETFAYQEPFYRAGAYGAVTILRWQDRLGRSIRDFQPVGDDPLFFAIGPGTPDLSKLRDRCAAYGWTRALNEAKWSGFAAILQATSPDAVHGMLPYTPAAEVRRWRVGGRPPS